jgi:ribosomal protein S18 acetylase RimI-like enzyme
VITAGSPRARWRARQYCLVAITLRRPSADEYAGWFAESVQAYIEEIAASGAMSRAAAEEKGRRDHQQLLPHGLDTPGQSIFRVEADGQPVGWLWFALEQPRPEPGVGFIFDISVDEKFRGRGYGRAAMQLAEEEARRNGLHALALNVFGQNTVARGLYAGLGYRETSVQMRKEL